ncbi:MAG: PilN domain-containing protein [Kiritimatiellales bacterium]|nr:PilN domain-containing protein [Kiritimatiellales bacterium]
MREQLLTAVNRTVDGIEWTILRNRQDGIEIVQQDSMSLTLPDEASIAELPAELLEKMKGEVVIPIPSSQLLLRVMELPATEKAELADMIALQGDKISPFPVDQLTLAHEVLRQTDKTSTVLLAGAQRFRIDEIGDEFKKAGVNIHSMDARVLGWLELLKSKEYLPMEGCSVFLIDDGIDFTLIITESGIPMNFRTLERPEGAVLVDELAYEIEYSLTSVETEFGGAVAASIGYWSFATVPADFRQSLAEKCAMPVTIGDLAELPPLSEGIANRACLLGTQRIELIPNEWIEHEKTKKLRRLFIISFSAIAALWLLVLFSFVGIYQYRNMNLSRAQSRADAIAEPARVALENREKMKALNQYSDRSASALECLREVTRMLPAGDIDFVSFNYKKGKGLTLRGTSASDDIVYDFFGTLSTSSIFKRLKDQSVSTKTTKNIRRSVYSLTLDLPEEEEQQ